MCTSSVYTKKKHYTGRMLSEVDRNDFIISFLRRKYIKFVVFPDEKDISKE